MNLSGGGGLGEVGLGGQDPFRPIEEDDGFGGPALQPPAAAPFNQPEGAPFRGPAA